MASRRKKGAGGDEGPQSGSSGELPKGAQAAPTTATGQALAQNAGSEERIKGKERGSTQAIAGGAPKGDWQKPRPVGAQKEPARWAVNGSVPAASVPSQSGPVPVGAVALTPEEGERALEAFEQGSRGAFKINERIPAERIARMSRAELLSVAESRGYDMRDTMGTRVSRTRFLALQDEDDTLEDVEVPELEEGSEERARYSLGRPPLEITDSRRVTNRTARS